MTSHQIQLPEKHLEDGDFLEVICHKSNLQMTINQYTTTFVPSETDFGLKYGNGKLDFISASALDNPRYKDSVMVIFRVRPIQ